MSEYNKEKFKNAVLYIAKYGGLDVGKKKLAKILYFIDFTLYELRQNSLTGMNYTKMNYGPMPEPIVFYEALEELENDMVININRNKPGEIGLEKITPKTDPDMTVFEDAEKEYLQQITQRYEFESAGNLERLAQSEPPYKMVNHEDMIPYHLAFYRNSFGEMDLGDETV